MTHITQLPLCWNSFQKSPKHLSVHIPYFRCIRNFPKAFAPLSVPPYGSGELQTWSRPLSDQWSTWCSGKQCWPLCSPRCWYIIEPLNNESNSLCIRYLVCPRPDLSINHTIGRSRYRQTLLLVPVTLHIPVTESHVCKLDGCNCHRVGPGYLSVTRTYRSWSWCTRLNL